MFTVWLECVVTTKLLLSLQTRMGHALIHHESNDPAILTCDVRFEMTN